MHSPARVSLSSGTIWASFSKIPLRTSLAFAKVARLIAGDLLGERGWEGVEDEAYCC